MTLQELNKITRFIASWRRNEGNSQRFWIKLFDLLDSMVDNVEEIPQFKGTLHEEIIEKILEDFSKSKLTYGLSLERCCEIQTFIEQALQKVREDTIRECIEALPEEIIDLRYHRTGKDADDKHLDMLRNGHIIAIRQAKQNLTNLIK